MVVFQAQREESAMIDMDTTGWTPEERSAWRWYVAVVNDLADKPKI